MRRQSNTSDDSSKKARSFHAVPSVCFHLKNRSPTISKKTSEATKSKKTKEKDLLSLYLTFDDLSLFHILVFSLAPGENTNKENCSKRSGKISLTKQFRFSKKSYETRATFHEVNNPCTEYEKL